MQFLGRFDVERGFAFEATYGVPLGRPTVCMVHFLPACLYVCVLHVWVYLQVVDPHSESDRCDDDRDLSTHPCLLDAAAIPLLLHAGVLFRSI